MQAQNPKMTLLSQYVRAHKDLSLFSAKLKTNLPVTKSIIIIRDIHLACLPAG